MNKKSIHTQERNNRSGKKHSSTGRVRKYLQHINENSEKRSEKRFDKIDYKSYETSQHIFSLGKRQFLSEHQKYDIML